MKVKRVDGMKMNSGGRLVLDHLAPDPESDHPGNSIASIDKSAEGIFQRLPSRTFLANWFGCARFRASSLLIILSTALLCGPFLD